MQYHKAALDPLPSLDTLSASQTSTLAAVSERALQSLQLCDALNDLPHVKTSRRDELHVRAQEILQSDAWLERDLQLRLPEERVRELVMQRLSRQFFITERFTSFAAGNTPYIAPRTESLEARVETFSSKQLALVNRISEYCPFSAGMTAVFLSEILIPAAARSRAGAHAIQSAEQHKAALELAGDAITFVDAAANKLLTCSPQMSTPSSLAIIEAWKSDLILPIIEASIFTTAAGMTPLSIGYDAGGCWYTPRFHIPGKQEEARQFYTDWRDLCAMKEIFSRITAYEGIDLTDRGEKHRAIMDRILPVPLLVTANDMKMLFSWYRRSFESLDSILGNLASNQRTVRPSTFQSGGIAEFQDGSQFVLRSRADAHGNARMGFTTPKSLGEVSIRLDFEDGRLALDFGAIDPRQLLIYAKEVLRENKRPIAYYNELRSQLAASTGQAAAVRDAHTDKLVRLNQAAARIGHYSAPEDSSMREIPYSIAAVSGIGRSLGLRSDETIGHHSREASYKLSTTRSRIAREFEECINVLTAALLNNRK